MEPQSLNFLDYSVLSIILLSGLLALMRGFVREMLSLAAWGGAYFIAAKFYPLAEPWAHKYVKSTTGANVLAAVVLFVVALIIFTLLAYFAAKLIRGRALTAIDRSLGFFFGLVRGALIVCLIYLGATYIPWLNMEKLDNPSAKPQIEEERVNPAVEAAKEKDQEKDKEQPPIWLVQAKTRPALAYGADILKVFIPEKELEKTMEKTMEATKKEYDDQNTAAQHQLNEKMQEIIGMPAKPPEKPQETPSYDTQDRTKMDQLFKQQNPQSP